MWQHRDFTWDGIYGSNGVHAIAAIDAYGATPRGAKYYLARCLY
jgi:hypothetical protein|eukprot:COSAG01_NODE_1350_length_10605_cov_43.649743_4_plen_44_part_00